MPNANFDVWVNSILKLEGGYSNDPKDPGGETNFGICKRSYPDLDIKNLTIDQAKAIYKRDYWDAVRANDLSYPLNVFMFDAAVNQGVVAAITLLQSAVGVQQDGKIGPATVAAANNAGREAAALFMAARAIRYANNPNFTTYGKGWLKRLFSVAMEV